jgi:hypothetical protein
VILASTLNEMVSPYGVGEKHAIEMAAGSALEDLTLLNRAVKEIAEATYQGKYDNPGAPCSGLVRFGGKATDAWIQRCDLTHAGSNPISFSASHVTVRDSLISKAYNKGGKGHGYVEFGGASHVLLYNCRFEDLRHLSIMWKTRYLVILKCSLNVDLNFHDGLPEKCLVEGNDSQPRGGHHWGSLSYGWPPWQKVGPGPRNFLWNNRLAGAGAGDRNVFVLRDTTGGYESLAQKEPMELDFGPPPRHGTLYAVTGQDIPAELVQKGHCLAKLREAVARQDVTGIFTFGRRASALCKAGEAEQAEALAAVAKVETDAEAALKKLGDPPTPAAITAYLGKWAGAAASERVRERAATLARAEWDALAVGGKVPGAYQLRQFVRSWDGVTGIDYAREPFGRLADQEYASREKLFVRPAIIQKFMADWPGTAAATRAEAKLVELLAAALASIEAKAKQMTRSQRAAALQDFLGTPLEAKARQVLE